MRIIRPLLILGVALILALPAVAEQDARKVHRASEVGGTGMMLMRIGDQLDQKEMNASIFLDYFAFSVLPLMQQRHAKTPMMDDPRGKYEMWATLTYNYGITNYLEAGIQLPFMMSQSASKDLREGGIGRIGIDARGLILTPDKMGFGVSATLWGSAPSFQKRNSSNNINGGGELAFELLGTAGTNYLGSEGFDRYVLEPLRLYANLGWGWEDYVSFKQYTGNTATAGVITTDDLAYIGKSLNKAKGKGPIQPVITGTEVLYVNLGLEYEVYDQLFVGGEALMRQWPHYMNDNNFIIVLPEVTYTHKDKFTGGLAFGFTGFRAKGQDQPDWLVKAGFTYHFPELSSGPAVRPPETAPPQDLIDIFVPSRKPVPTETSAPETPAPGGGEEVPPDSQ